MKVIVIGAGRVGRTVAQRLSAEKHDIVVVDVDTHRLELVTEAIDADAVQGHGASPQLLRSLKAEDAELLVGVTGNDEVNVLAAGVAKRLGTQRSVARTEARGFDERDAAFAHRELGIDYLVDPARAAADDIAETLLVPGASHAEHFLDSGLKIAEVTVSDGAPMDGVCVGDLQVSRRHFVVGVTNNGTTKLALDASHRLGEGDHLVVAAPRDEIGATVFELAGRQPPVESVLIYGAESMGLYLARKLAEQDVAVTVLDPREDKARELAEQAEDVEVIVDDATQATLERQAIESTDAFIAASRDEQDNLIAASHAHELGASRSMSLVWRNDLLPLAEKLGIEGAFSPLMITAEAILKFARGRGVRAMHMLPSGFEIYEVQADEGSDAVGCGTETGACVDGGAIAAIQRGDQILMAPEADEIEPGDRVILCGETGAVTEVEKAFTG